MKTNLLIRKSHRYLGLFLGIQFLVWTISGLYFSWTNIDDIHGDQFRKPVKELAFSNLKSPSELLPNTLISKIDIRNIAAVPYYWVNNTILINAKSGEIKSEITEQEALQIANNYVIDELEVKEIQKIIKTDKQHEYRKNPLPAFVITYKHSEEVKAYISVKDGKFRKIRYRAWRWFDFLWATHIMDYDERDNINNLLLRIFSLLGVISVFSGFILWFISSPRIRKLRKM